jgi:lysophospholipase L1-like esterase
MRTVAVNVFDERRQDNTTPASPARVFDDDWHAVVFAAEDFHYNSDPPDRKIEGETAFKSLLFHGQEDGPAAELWIDKLVVYRGADTRPPGAPAGVRADLEADGSVALSWQEPADETFPVVFSIHRKSGAGAWEKIGESLRPSFRDRTAVPEKYAYRITAADYENNVSPPSSEVMAAPAAAAAKPASGSAPPRIADRAGYADHIRQVHARGAGKVRPDVFLFAGDSLTAATLYTHALGSWLGRGLTVRQGVGTVTTDYGAANIKGYLADARPEFAVVMYGTNDVGSGVSVSNAMRNLGAVLDACIEFGTVPILATIPPRGFDKGDQRRQEDFNRAIADLGRKKRIPVSYLFEEMMRQDLKEMLFDGIHLTPERGNDVAGRALRLTMDQVYFALRDTSGGW